MSTIKSVIDTANLNNLPAGLQKLKLGTLLETLLTVQTYDTGTITAAADVALPGGALFVQFARVVTSGTAASVGTYIVHDNDDIIVPPGGAKAAVGIAKLSADGKTITFPNTVTRVVVQYIKAPVSVLADTFENA